MTVTVTLVDKCDYSDWIKENIGIDPETETKNITLYKKSSRLLTFLRTYTFQDVNQKHRFLAFVNSSANTLNIGAHVKEPHLKIKKKVINLAPKENGIE